MTPALPTEPVAGLICPNHGKVDIDSVEYRAQMARPNARWSCPHCRKLCEFDDARYEELNY